jgi:hypothetical protein
MELPKQTQAQKSMLECDKTATLTEQKKAKCEIPVEF